MVNLWTSGPVVSCAPHAHMQHTQTRTQQAHTHAHTPAHTHCAFPLLSPIQYLRNPSIQSGGRPHDACETPKFWSHLCCEIRRVQKCVFCLCVSQEWFSTSCWWATLLSGTRTSTNCTSRSRPELMMWAFFTPPPPIPPSLFTKGYVTQLPHLYFRMLKCPGKIETERHKQTFKAKHHRARWVYSFWTNCRGSVRVLRRTNPPLPPWVPMTLDIIHVS